MHKKLRMNNSCSSIKNLYQLHHSTILQHLQEILLRVQIMWLEGLFHLLSSTNSTPLSDQIGKEIIKVLTQQLKEVRGKLAPPNILSRDPSLPKEAELNPNRFISMGNRHLHYQVLLEKDLQKIIHLRLPSKLKSCYVLWNLTRKQ